MSGAKDMAAVIPGPASDGAVAARDSILEVRGVRKTFGGVKALDGVDMSVARGSVAGLIGPNGAGKSTLFNVVTGVITPDEGVVRLSGTEIAGRSLEQMARAGIGRTFQAPRGFSSMTVLENLLVVPPSAGERLSGALLPRRRARRAARARAEDILGRLGLARQRDVPYGELSGGELRLLEIARHLMRDIDMLMLDEPTAGVAPAMQERIADVVSDLSRSGITVLIVEHNLRFVFGLASNVSVMVAGRVISAGSPADIQRDPAVIAAYLGGGVKE
jgi:ABC-type branched-subunit amino acid transport system ATPase component